MRSQRRLIVVETSPWHSSIRYRRRHFQISFEALYQRLHLSRTWEPVVDRAAVIQRLLVEKEDSVGENEV